MKDTKKILVVLMLFLIGVWAGPASDPYDTGFHTSKSYMIKAILKAFDEMGINKKDVNDQDNLLYFFTVHDYDQDGLLDGHELRVAFGDHDDSRKMILSEVEKIIDDTLEEDDTDNDGKISWEEYLASIKYHEQI